MKNTDSYLHHYGALNSNIFLFREEDLENLNKKKPNLGESWADKQKLFEEN